MLIETCSAFHYFTLTFILTEEADWLEDESSYYFISAVTVNRESRILEWKFKFSLELTGVRSIAKLGVC